LPLPERHFCGIPAGVVVGALVEQRREKMTSITFFRDLRARLARALKHSLKQILKARSDPEPTRAKALDVYTAAGYVLRASSAFVGSLTDYIEHRATLGEANDSVAERKLKSTADYFGDSIDTLISAVAAFDSLPSSEPSGNGKAGVQAAADLSRELSSDSPALDRYRVILAEARDNHESLRHTVNDLRKIIKQTYAIPKAMSF